MNLSSKAENIYARIRGKGTQLQELRKIAKAIKKDHALAMELWSTEEFLPRMLGILIMDKNLLSQELIDKLDKEIRAHPKEEQTRLMDWLLSNQLVKNLKTIELLESWENSPSSLQRRAFWYYQSRLRWMGKPSPANTADLLAKIETNIAQEEPEVQWTMNFTAGWIGIYNEAYRARCIDLGRRMGFYKDEMVSKGCTPSYLPEFIRIEVDKRNKQ